MAMMTRDEATKLVTALNTWQDTIDKAEKSHAKDREKQIARATRECDTFIQLLSQGDRSVELDAVRYDGQRHWRLVLTEEEKAADHAKQVQWALEQRATELKQAVATYKLRLEQMIAHCQYELQTLESGRLAEVNEHEWGSTAALDLPRLSMKIHTMARDAGARDGKFY